MKTALQSLIALLRKNPEPDASAHPEGICPNCWGKQEYGGQFYEAVKNHGNDANTPDHELGWIQDYANRNLSGIHLKHDNEGLVCPKCKVSYIPE